MIHIPKDLKERIKTAILIDNYYEGAVEAIFSLYPELTRDEVVNIIEEVIREMRIK